jgi:hypothetical protein
MITSAGFEALSALAGIGRACLRVFNCRIISSAVSTVLRVRRCPVTELQIGSSVDTAIWNKPCGDLAGQLLNGDSIQRSNFVPTPTLICAEKF